MEQTILTETAKQRLRAWCAALRSGEFKQCHGALKMSEAYCCLGVTCELHARAGLGGWTACGDYRIGEDALRITGILPGAVKEWLFDGHYFERGSDGNVALLRPDGTETCAIGMNDHEGATFAEIAEAAERTYQL